ncbi:MAG: cellulose biosynthesis protein BcsS [Hyphomicrobium sp.]
MCDAPDLQRHRTRAGGHPGATAGMVLALLACANAANAADKPQAYEISAGFDAAPQSLYWYSEGIAALNGDIAKDGFLLRTYGSLAVYQYATNAVAGIVDGELWQLDLMPGYQFVRGSVIFGGYVGLDYQQSQLLPDDPTNQVNGTTTGIKVEGHYYYSDDKQPFEGSLVGEYSTAFDTYYAEARIGARIAGQLFMGPDASVDGDTGYDAQRLGGYARYAFDLSKGVPLSVTVIAGHQFVSGGGGGFGGGAGTFGTLQLDTNF